MVRSAMQLLMTLALALGLGALAPKTNAQGLEPGLGPSSGPGLGQGLGLDLGPEPGSEVSVEVKADRVSVEPGGQFVIAVVLDHTEGFHSWPAAHEELDPELDSFAIRTEIVPFDSVEPPAGLTAGPVQWPKTKLSTVPSPTGVGTVEAPTYAGRAVFYIPLLVSGEAEVGSTFEIPLRVSYQACDDAVCLPPEDVQRTLTLPVVAVGSGEGAADTTDFAAFDPKVFAEVDAWDEAAIAERTAASATGQTGPSFFGFTLPRADGAAGIIMLGLLAAVGGFILNLTPCVLPVIPIKIMTISQHAGTPGKSLMLGLWMAVGIVAFWTALGVLAASFSKFADPSRLFGIWWFTLGIGVLIAAMGVGIMGAFAINLPQQVYAVNPKADTPHGSFLFGVMTAVLGLPCFGFVAGALLAGSATMPWWVVLTIFAALGIGMAAPYLVLSAKPAWVDKIPRTGPASELVKQVMGLLLLAAGSYFAGSGVLALLGGIEGLSAGLPWWAKVIHWWLVGLFAAAAGVWLLWRTVQITPSAARRGVFSVIAIVLAAGGVGAAVDRTNEARHNFWEPYSPDSLAAALDADQVVVLDFTAEWCLNCKTLEATVLNREPVKGLLLGAGVIPLKADLTSTSAQGWDRLRDLGQTGIPTLAVFGPGIDQPWIANAYTPGQVVEAIERARGG